MSGRLRRRAPLLLTALVAVAITIPATAFGIHQFTDVPNDNPFHTDIDALADSGVTTGCGTGIYCPKDFVTREQMAAFMNRLGALSPSKTPVVNADKLDGFDSSELVQHGQLIEYISGGYAATSDAPNTVVKRTAGSTRVTSTVGTSFVVLELRAPAYIPDTSYGLKSVQVCFLATTGSDLVEIGVSKVTAAGAATDVIFETVNQALDFSTCVTASESTTVDMVDGSLWLGLTLTHGNGSTAPVDIATTRLTWAPIGPVAP